MFKDNNFEEFEFDDEIENLGIQKIKDKRNIELSVGNRFDKDGNKVDVSLKEAKELNKKIIASHPMLQNKNLDDRTLYNKKFLLEVSMSGYDALDTEDVENYINGLPSKQENRNEILAGVGVYNELGQSEYDDEDFGKFLKVNKNVEVAKKDPNAIYLTDFNIKGSKEMLVEQKEANFDFENVKLKKFQEKRSMAQIENDHRKHIAEQFGSKNIKFNFEQEQNFATTFEGFENKNTGVVKSTHDPEKILELIKELRALGFTPEEIKFEIQQKYL